MLLYELFHVESIKANASQLKQLCSTIIQLINHYLPTPTHSIHRHDFESARNCRLISATTMWIIAHLAKYLVDEIVAETILAIILFAPVATRCSVLESF